MTIYPICTTIMKYRIIQTLAEAYYRYRVKKPCFIMRQNNRWTLVTMTSYDLHGNFISINSKGRCPMMCDSGMKSEPETPS